MELALSSLINALYIVAICSVVLASSIPCLSSLLKYGKTLTNVSNSSKDIRHSIMHIYVPKKWFTHFYLLSLALSLLVLSLLILDVDYPLANWLSEYNTYLMLADLSISRHQCLILLLLNFIQAIRRSYECLFVSKFGVNSKINLSHYLVGIFFYSSINILPTIYYIQGIIEDPYNFEKGINIPAWRMVLCIMVFGYGSYQQGIHHRFLSSVKKYNVPQGHWFKYSSCPHYFFEILIYSTHLLISFNSSTILTLIWVAINLGVSSNEIYKFYIENSQEKLDGTHYWRMIPFIF